jgi:DNA-binding transcriptional regulator GbsR (MarR family)
MALPANDLPASDQDALLRFVERFALVIANSGIPRMPARVFAYVLAEDAERYTATELATGLRVSPAAISGAVRYLVQVGLLAREREPGARSDHYRVFDSDVWGVITATQIPVIQSYQDAAAEGVKTLRAGSAGAKRMRETEEYFAFLMDEMQQMRQRWRDRRRSLRLDQPEGPDHPDQPSASPPRSGNS